VRRLRADGVITGFTATVDLGATGRRLVALIDVRLAASGTNAEFEAEMEKLEAITDAVHVTGRFDYQLRVACRDTAELDRLLRHLKREGGVTETETRVVLRSAFTRGAP
jgi:Lrp/AsnC family transcriptional regulator, leucine-responsive regulatory protein